MERELAPMCAHVFESLGRIMTTCEYEIDRHGADSADTYGTPSV